MNLHQEGVDLGPITNYKFTPGTKTPAPTFGHAGFQGSDRCTFELEADTAIDFDPQAANFKLVAPDGRQVLIHITASHAAQSRTAGGPGYLVEAVFPPGQG